MSTTSATFTTTRQFPVVPAAVFKAIQDPACLATWWGPDGFTNRFDVFEFELFWEQAFDDPAVAQAVRHIVEPANEQNLDRLSQVLGAGL